MTTKIADDFIAISRRLQELTRRQRLMEERRVELEQDYIICPDCRGHGGFAVPHQNPDCLPELAPCYLCGGTGTVEIN